MWGKKSLCKSPTGSKCIVTPRVYLMTLSSHACCVFSGDYEKKYDTVNVRYVYYRSRAGLSRFLEHSHRKCRRALSRLQKTNKRVIAILCEHQVIEVTLFFFFFLVFMTVFSFIYFISGHWQLFKERSKVCCVVLFHKSSIQIGGLLKQCVFVCMNSSVINKPQGRMQEFVLDPRASIQSRHGLLHRKHQHISYLSTCDLAGRKHHFLMFRTA